MTQSEIEKAAEEYLSEKMGREYNDPKYNNTYLCWNSSALKDSFLAGAEHARARWISVKERMPDKDGYYLVYRVSNSMRFVVVPVTTREFRGGKWITNARVTHWMPSPTAPEEQR